MARDFVTVTGVKEFAKKMNALPVRIQKLVEPIRDKYAQKILAFSNKHVPIDKRYVGRFRAEEVTKVDRPIQYDITQSSVQDYQNTKQEYIKDMYDFLLATSTKDRPSAFTGLSAEVQYDRRTGYQTFGHRLRYGPTFFTDAKGYTQTRTASGRPSAVFGEFAAGVYTGDKAAFIRKFFKTPNHRTRQQLFVDYRGGLHAGRPRYDNIPSKLGLGLKSVKPDRSFRGYLSAKGEMSGGNQELKRSGMITKNSKGEMFISYDPSRINPKLWNYAALQHNNLDFKHAKGKNALFLFNAVEKYRYDYYEEISRATGRAIKGVFR